VQELCNLAANRDDEKLQRSLEKLGELVQHAASQPENKGVKRKEDAIDAEITSLRNEITLLRQQAQELLNEKEQKVDELQVVNRELLTELSQEHNQRKDAERWERRRPRH
jgi:hypothetical protein